MVFTGFFLGFTGFYLVLVFFPALSGLHLDFMVFTGYYWVSPSLNGFTGFSWVFARFFCVSPSFNGFVIEIGSLRWFRSPSDGDGTVFLLYGTDNWQVDQAR